MSFLKNLKQRAKQRRADRMTNTATMHLYANKYKQLETETSDFAEKDAQLRAWRFLLEYSRWYDTIRTKQRKLRFFTSLTVFDVIISCNAVYQEGLTAWRVFFVLVTIALFYTIQEDRAELKQYKRDRPRYKDAFTSEEQVLGLLRKLRQ